MLVNLTVSTATLSRNLKDKALIAGYRRCDHWLHLLEDDNPARYNAIMHNEPWFDAFLYEKGITLADYNICYTLMLDYNRSLYSTVVEDLERPIKPERFNDGLIIRCGICVISYSLFNVLRSQYRTGARVAYNAHRHACHINIDVQQDVDTNPFLYFSL